MEGKRSAVFPSYLISDLDTPFSPSHVLADAEGKPAGFLALAAVDFLPFESGSQGYSEKPLNSALQAAAENMKETEAAGRNWKPAAGWRPALSASP